MTPSVDTITDPNDYSTFNSSDDRPHVHDYWNGATEVELFEGPFKLTRTGNLYEVPVPAGKLVNPGTRWVNATATWDLDTTGRTVSQTPPLFLHYAKPFGAEEKSVRFTKDRRTTVPTNETTNDLPHSPSTRWEFSLQAGSDEQPFLAGEVQGRLRINVSRPPGSLPVAPPHPDYWKNRTELNLTDEWGPMKFAVLPPSSSGQGPPTEVIPHPVVPPLTNTLVLRLFYNSTTPPEVHFRPTLSYGGADRGGQTFEATRKSADASHRASPGFFAWSIPVHQRMWDSVYANSTQWQIFVQYVWDPESDEPPHIVDMEGDYHLVLRAQHK